jgi:hypothetical protein
MNIAAIAKSSEITQIKLIKLFQSSLAQAKADCRSVFDLSTAATRNGHGSTVRHAANLCRQFRSPPWVQKPQDMQYPNVQFCERNLEFSYSYGRTSSSCLQLLAHERVAGVQPVG